ncbi:MAG: glucan biosynthesis protein [Roseobacter sp.]
MGQSASRRAFLKGATALVMMIPGSAVLALNAGPSLASIRDFEQLVSYAQAAAREVYAPPVVPMPELIDLVDYSAHWQIRFRKTQSLYPGADDAAVQFFHPGRFFPEPVAMYLRDPLAGAREVPFDKSLFDMPVDSPAQDLPAGYGFAGFRIMRPDMKPDWVSFLGASYFRTDGPEGQYGLSARGLAINTGLNQPEEFPRFSAFWLGPAEREGDDLSVWALLEGPSVSGAYRFGLAKSSDQDQGHVTGVAAHVFMREDVERIGIAPLTSMYWYSETDRVIGKDWRPEIHDSDGLALATGNGERIWRPLNNPATLSTSSFFDSNPRGFGLVQRDRDFNHYQDDGVFYDKRPSAWVRPRGDWGRGAVQLIEIPTEDETFDNIVAYWVPEQPARKGDAFTFEYDIEWRARDPENGGAATVVATRQGQGGIPGDPIPEGVGKIVIDFEGEALNGLDRESGVTPVVEASNGVIVDPVGAYPIVGTKQWRLAFDFRQANSGPVSLRAYLRLEGKALTETWLSDAWINIRS